MNNLFETENYPSSEPTQLPLGSRWAWRRPDISSVYSTAFYTLKYVISSLDGARDFEITANKVNGAHVIEMPIAETQQRVAGDYKWTAIIVRDTDSEEVNVDEGLVTLFSSTGEIASHVYKTLMAIRATILKKASQDQLSYTINGRSLQRYSFQELSKLEADYSKRYKAEREALDRKNGRKGKNRVLTKLGA